MSMILLIVTDKKGRVFKCAVHTKNVLTALKAFAKLFCATSDIVNISIETIYALEEDGTYLDKSM